MISPTGKGPRGYDKQGSGAYRAPRGKRLHAGVDYVCEPGQQVVAPIAGTITRKARPYAQGKWSGCVITGPRVTVKMFYFKLGAGMVGRTVAQGDVIGVAQDIGEKYTGITPHVHLQVEAVDPGLLMEHGEEG